MMVILGLLASFLSFLYVIAPSIRFVLISVTHTIFYKSPKLGAVELVSR